MKFQNGIFSLIVTLFCSTQMFANSDRAFEAIVTNDSRGITRYIEQMGDLNVLKDGNGLLHECALRTRFGIARQLVESGRINLLALNQNQKRGDQLVGSGKTADLLKRSLNQSLKQALHNNDIDYIRDYLATEHAIDEPVDSDGNTLLHLSSQYARKAITDMLNDAGANFLIKNYEQKIPLDVTTGAGKTHRLILAKTNRLYRLLKDAVLDNFGEIIISFPDLSKMDLNRSVDDAGNTLLHIAAEQSRFLISQILVDAGAKTDIRNEDGQVAADKTSGRGKTFRYLKMQDARPFHHHLNDHIFHITGADYLRALGYTGRSVNVAIFDASGVDFNGPGLNQEKKISGGGYIFGHNLVPYNTYTGQAHGFNMARALGGLSGVDGAKTGAAPDVKIMPFVGATGTDVVANISVLHNIKVASISLQRLKFSEIWQRGQNALAYSDVLFVIIAGNSIEHTHKESMLKTGFPGPDEDILNHILISVNVGVDGKLMPKSRKCGNVLKNYCVALPGKSKGTTSPTGAFLNGGIALLRQAFPLATAPQIRQAILETAIPLGKDTDTGRVMVDFKGAFEYLRDTLGMNPARP